MHRPAGSDHRPPGADARRPDPRELLGGVAHYTGPPGHDEIGANAHLQVIPESILETSDGWDGRCVGQNGEALGVKLVSRLVRQPDLVLVPHAWSHPEKSERTSTTRSAEEDLGLDLHLIPPRPSTPLDAAPTLAEDPLDPDVVWQIYREALRSGQNDEEARCSTTAALGEEAAEVLASTLVSRNPEIPIVTKINSH